jgi:predicted RNase H-like nuclease (RuvC/YqgF family)
LCCAACISKIRNKGNGEHKNCKVYDISKIKNKKKNILEQNIESLEELSNKLEPSINELKTIFEKLMKQKII